MMKCEKFFKSFMNLEDYAVIPVRLRFHLLMCPKCKKEADLIRKAMSNLQNNSSFDPGISLGNSIMKEISPEPSPLPMKKLSVFKWVSVGLIIFMSLFLITYSKSYIWLEHSFGARLLVPMSFVLGFVLSIYLLVVMGFNYFELSKGVINSRFLKKLNLK